MKQKLFLCILVIGWPSIGIARPETLLLNEDGVARSHIVILCRGPEPPLAEFAAETIVQTVEIWGSCTLPTVRIREAPDGGAKALDEWPRPPAIVLTTLDDLDRIMPELADKHHEFAAAAFLDDHGYLLVPVTVQGKDHLFVVGRTWRGVYNGAVYVRDFAIDGPAGRLEVNMEAVVRAPVLRRRPVYVLTIWGEEDEYSVDDWKRIFDAFARDGVTDIYFWLSGHFPSTRFPQTYKVRDRDWDSTVDSRIGTIEDQRALIHYAHDRGMRFFLGGGLGAWSGTFNLTHRAPGTMRENSTDESGNDVSIWALCPASERSRKALIAYYTEMFDALPEADGLYIESADEYGECQCDRCRVPLDEPGSRMFGQYQLSLMQQMMREIWTNHPEARLAYTIGYSPHKEASRYYEVIRRMSADPRVEWMEARSSWTFPGPSGHPMPPGYFSPRIMRWDYGDIKPLESMLHNTWEAARSGMAGYISTFSPGFASGSFYHEIPFPVDKLPYLLTHFIHREACWQPVPDPGLIKGRVKLRFFGGHAPDALVDHLWSLRELMRSVAHQKINADQLELLERLEEAVADARAEAFPRMREGLDLMQSAIDDIRRVCAVQTDRAPE